jgi:hypothetical protein
MAVRKSLMPLFFLFVVINSMSIVFRGRMTAMGFDTNVLLIGNFFLCALTFFSFYMLYKGMKAATTAGFLRSVYGSFMIKLLLVAVVVLGYAFLYKENINKPSLFTCMFLYLVYTFIETRALLKLSKKSTNA